jgi:protein SCO1/2
MTDQTQTKNHGKLVSIILLVLVIFSALTLYPIIKHANGNKTVKIDGLYLTTAKEINDFKLKSTTGVSYTKKNLQGHWTMMFFGFTNCGMVCPLTMTELRNMYQTLASDLPASDLPEVVMVSVDPERDSIQRLKEYVTAFHPKFRGARAEMPEIDLLKKQLHLVSVKMQSGAGKNQYTINHSAEIMLFNPEGKLQAFLAYPHTAEQMATDYKAILKNKST